MRKNYHEFRINTSNGEYPKRQKVFDITCVSALKDNKILKNCEAL